MRILVVGDCHISQNCTGEERFAALGRLERRINTDAAIFIGDVLTCDSLNQHIAVGSGEHKALPSFIHEVGLLRAALSAYRKGANRRACFRHVTLGNHDGSWPAAMENKHPELTGLVTSQILGTFEQAGLTHSPYGALFDLAGVYFTHVPIFQGRRLTDPNKIGARFDQSVVWGHSHVFTVHSYAKSGKAPIKVINAGCYLPEGHKESYTAHNSVDGWTRGALVLDVDAGDVRGVNWLDIGAV